MKRLLAILLVLTMVFAFAACGPKTPATEQTEAPQGEDGDKASTEDEKAPTPEGKVHVLYYDYSDTYISSVRAELDKALDAAGIKYQNYDSANDQAKQNELVQTALNDQAAVLVVNVVNTSSEDAAKEIVKMAKEKDIPVIFFNREVSDDVVKSYEKSAFIGTDAPEAGHLQGGMIGDFLLADYDKYDLNGDGKISYVMFKGEEGNNEAIYRTQYGVEDADAKLKEAGKPALEFYDPQNADKYLVDQAGKWSAQASKEYMDTILSQHSMDKNNMIELVICNNDGMAEGAVSALEEAGFNLGSDNPDSVMIPVFGVDATDAAKALIADGKMSGTVKQDATGMANAIAELASNGLAGKGLLEGSQLIVDEGVAKVRIPYQVYTGE